jgi:class 3 adenylate cyclase
MRCVGCGSAHVSGMRFCGMCGRPLAHASGERERRRVSVLFVDLMGFSTLTHDLDPEELRDLADEVLTVVAGVVEDYDGYVDSFRGDGLIAVFGAPHSHPDDPYRAVVVAAASLRAIESIGQARGLDLRGRAGVGTGMVIAGSVGSGRVREYTVMGSTVNLASRLETAAGPGQVWVSEETFQASRHRLTFERVHGVSLPGFPTVTSAYRFLADQERDHDPYQDLPFVGRAEELRRLDEILASVRLSGRARQVWLVGEAGSGKTRLLREFERRIDPGAARPMQVRDPEGRPDPSAQGANPRALGAPAPEGPPNGVKTVWVASNATQGFRWTALADQLFGLRSSDDERSRHMRVQRSLERIMPGQGRWHRLILGSLDLAPGVTWNRLERRSIDRTMIAWRDVLVALLHGPVAPAAIVLVVECERAETSLEQFVGLLAGADAPILVLRPTRGRDLPPGTERLAMTPLSLDESRTLLDQVTDPVFRVVAHSLVEQVGGVPASIFELAHALSATPETHVSASLMSLLQARLDALEPRTRRLLAVAALVGERCWEGLLRATVPDVADDLGTLRHVDVLVREQTSTMPGEVEYRFRSELLRRAVLQMIPFAERPMAHLRIATWLEQNAPLSFAELAGEHFDRGGAPDAAYAHFLAAADEAEYDEDHAVADRLYRRLGELDVSRDLRAQAALAYAQAAILRGDGALAVDQLVAAEAAIDGCDDEACGRLRETHARLLGDALRLARDGATTGGVATGGAATGGAATGGAGTGGGATDEAPVEVT